jgi:SAM-dependent MidA family methyltransferase
MSGDQSPADRGGDCRNSYPIDASPATTGLTRELAARIARDGPLRFGDFMEAALYHPQHGYYAQPTTSIGRSGDFFTSVSTGPLFGQLLAARFLKDFETLGRPSRWRVTECGAHDGTLAGDVLEAICNADPSAYDALEYAVVEPLATLRERQQSKLASFGKRVRITSDPAALAQEPLPGLVFGNEVLDALPFDVLVAEEGSWKEQRVSRHERDGFRWERCAITEPALAGAAADLPCRPDGTRVEWRCGMEEFLRAMRQTVRDPLMIWIDYGFAAADLLAPGRSEGTMRVFSRHRASEDPLADPGRHDITAHVDFTAVARAAMRIGGTATDFRSQGSWLTGLAGPWLAAREGRADPAAARQFQTLTHPAHLGSRFHVIELSWRTGSSAADAADATTLEQRLFAPVDG